MNNFSNVPPGFRFHPTDEELVDYYLRRKIASIRIEFDVIIEVDLYKIEPWDLQELCRIGAEEQNDWYFFSHKDKKYPTGTRTNRATSAGFWKATGRDKGIYSKHDLIGMRKTLVFYKGRAPNGQKSDYIMHEYRLETDENGTAGQEEGWVICRVFKKRIPTTQKFSEHDSPIWYDDQVSFIPDIDSPKQHHNPYGNINLPHHYANYNISSCKKEIDLQYGIIPSDHFLQLPLLESPKMIQTHTSSPITSYGPGLMNMSPGFNTNDLNSSQEMNLDNKHFSSSKFTNNEQSADQVTDWRVLDKFVASQLRQHEISKQNETFPTCQDSNTIVGNMNITNDELAHENATSPSACQIDLWK